MEFCPPTPQDLVAGFLLHLVAGFLLDLVGAYPPDPAAVSLPDPAAVSLPDLAVVYRPDLAVVSQPDPDPAITATLRREMRTSKRSVNEAKTISSIC
jgi:hypothetical protein